MMIPELEKPRVTELHVRMDCSGCTHKVKRAVHGVEGVYDVFVDTAEQKLTVVGRADPEAILRSLKKIRKVATLISHTEACGDQPPPAEPPVVEAPAEAAADAQPPADAPGAEPVVEQPAAVPQPEPEAAAASDDAGDAGEFPMVHHYPHGYGHWNSNGYVRASEGPLYMVTHSYSNYRPSATVSEYAYGYAYGVVQPHEENVRYYHGGDYYDQRSVGSTYGNNGVASLFSDENPNACSIV